MKENIILIGSMGAGKSTIGGILAKYQHWNFVDTDKEIEKSCNASVSWIFDVEGETGFRNRETIMLKKIAVYNKQVIATGGGIVLSENNRSILKQIGTIVYLKVSVETQLRRLQYDKTRPLLQTDNPKDALEKIMSHRDPIYKGLAHYVIETDTKTPNHLTSELVGIIKRNLS